MRANLTGSKSRTYLACNRVCGDSAGTTSFAEELESSSWLQDVSDNGIPPSMVTYHEGDIAFITRTINKRAGLVTNARVRILELGDRIIRVEHLTSHRIFEIPRISFTFSPGTSSLSITRRQFPLALAYAITFNKAQGSYYQQRMSQC